ncbi:MAG TPA: hypothetical protein VGE18_03315 [Candidatus Paceibacterota bacterium]
MKKGVFLSALLSLLGIFFCVTAVEAGTYTAKKDIYSISITTTATDATGVVTLPRQSNGLKYTATLTVSTDPNTPCLQNCLYSKEITGINTTVKETFTLKGLDASKKYYLVISDTSNKHSVEFQVDGAKTFTTVGSTTAIAASLEGLRGNKNSFQLLVLTKPFEEKYVKKSGGLDGSAGLPLHPDSETIKKPDSNGQIRWNLGSFQTGTTYYARVIEIPATNTAGAFFTTEQKTVITQTVTISPDQLKFDYKNDTAIVMGRLDPAKNPFAQQYDVKIQYSKDAFGTFTETSPVKYKVYKGHDVTVKNEGIADDGTYFLFITGINSGTPYNIRETITFGGSKKVTDGVFNSSGGYTPSTAENIQNDFEDRSYRLLAPFPGLSVFLDPDLCAERAAAGETGQMCDINDFLNLGFKLLIGAAAVLLVLRIMFEGYKYITTDIPALKTSAKSGLWDAVLGLVLALSSFLILNTINPKLVENTVNVARLEIGVTVNEQLDGEGESIVNGKVVKVTSSTVTYAKQYGTQNACAGANGTTTTPNSATCVRYDGGIYSSARGKYVEKDFAQKLLQFNNQLKSKGVTWQVTEAWPQSRSHKANCHQTGLCIDMNNTTAQGGGSNHKPTVAQVKSVIETAASLNMCAKYEILNDSTLYKQLTDAGLGRNVMFFNGKWISANHYSLYNGICK